MCGPRPLEAPVRSTVLSLIKRTGRILSTIGAVNEQAERERQEKDKRHGSLRRLDDLLQALESLNLRDRTEVPEAILERLREVGIVTPEKHSVPKLIEKVWEVQSQYLVSVPVERRQYRRRRQRDGAPTAPWQPN